MKIEPSLTPEAVVSELGERLTRRRLELNMTQEVVAEAAGIAKRTLERIESGKDTQLSTLVRLLKVLELMDGLERLVPAPGPRPMELLKLRGKQRRRASGKSQEPEPSRDWQWGDEQ